MVDMLHLVHKVSVSWHSLAPITCAVSTPSSNVIRGFRARVYQTSDQAQQRLLDGPENLRETVTSQGA